MSSLRLLAQQFSSPSDGLSFAVADRRWNPVVGPECRTDQRRSRSSRQQMSSQFESLQSVSRSSLSRPPSFVRLENRITETGVQHFLRAVQYQEMFIKLNISTRHAGSSTSTSTVPSQGLLRLELQVTLSARARCLDLSLSPLEKRVRPLRERRTRQSPSLARQTSRADLQEQRERRGRIERRTRYGRNSTR